MLEQQPQLSGEAECSGPKMLDKYSKLSSYWIGPISQILPDK